MTTGAESKWDNFGGGNRGMRVDDFSDLFLVGIVDLSADAGRGRIIDLGLDVVNEPRLVRAVEFVQGSQSQMSQSHARGKGVMRRSVIFCHALSLSPKVLLPALLESRLGLKECSWFWIDSLRFVDV